MTEKRLIDATALKTQVCNIPAHGESEQFYAIMGEIARAIERAETVDAVNVVRCGECKYARPIPRLRRRDYTQPDELRDCTYSRAEPDAYGICGVWADGYCDEGKRKEAHNA